MLFQWFSDNQMKANISKCHPLANVNKEGEVTTRIGDTEIKNINTKLNFFEHLDDISVKLAEKLMRCRGKCLI